MNTFNRQNKAVLPQVQLIGTANGNDGATTGLSRYGSNLKNCLLAQGLTVATGATQPPPLPKLVYKAGDAFGFDLKTFFTTYPVRLAKNPAHNNKSIVHLTSQNQASAVAFRTPSPLVITVHDLITLVCRHEPEITGYLKFYDIIFDNIATYGMKKATMLIADSEQTRNDIITYLHYPASQIKVIYLGIDHQLFRPTIIPAEFLDRYNLNKTTSYVLYVGSEDPRKNLRRLLEAFAQVAFHLPDVKLLKVGAARFANERVQLLAEVKRFNLEGKVCFFDQVSDTDLAYFYNLAAVFVFPSLYEGFGWPPLEAMACGTPVITSNTASLPELVGEAALTLNPRDVAELAVSIERLLLDGELRANLSHKGLLQASEFNWERTAKETLAVYDQLLR